EEVVGEEGSDDSAWRDLPGDGSPGGEEAEGGTGRTEADRGAEESRVGGVDRGGAQPLPAQRKYQDRNYIGSQAEGLEQKVGEGCSYAAREVERTDRGRGGVPGGIERVIGNQTEKDE